MPEKIFVKQAVIVEGKYDKMKLQSIIDGLIIATDGFRIYKDKEKAEMIRAVANKQGIIVLTDSDAAGFKLRGFLKSIAKDAQIINLYIPQVAGKEKRKQQPGKEGLLGVEGIDEKIIRALFEKFCVSEKEQAQPCKKITKMDFYEDGLCGGKDAHALRVALAKSLELPDYISTNGLLEVINSLLQFDEYQNLIRKIKGE